MQINPASAHGLGQLRWVNLKNGAVSGGSNGGQAAVSNASSSSFAEMLQESSAGSAGETASPATFVAGRNTDDSLLWQQVSGASQTVAYGGISGEITDTLPTAYEELIAAASSKYGVPADLIKAVIDTESSFNPNVVSSAGAKGLMQLMDGTASGLGVSDPFDPAQSIDGGTRYLSYQLKRFDGQEKMALAAYNAGPGRVLKLGVSNDQELMEQLSRLPKETQSYISKIERAREQYAV